LWLLTKNRHVWRGREFGVIVARPLNSQFGDLMSTFARSLVALGLALSLAACATTPPPPEMTPPPKKCLDAKTQLETGRKC
jgi:hypothetical protein